MILSPTKYTTAKMRVGNSSTAALAFIALTTVVGCANAFLSPPTTPTTKITNANNDKNEVSYKLLSQQQPRANKVVTSSPQSSSCSSWLFCSSKPTSCEPAQSASATTSVQQQQQQSSSFKLQDLENPKLYKRLNAPSRMLEDSHAVVQLLKPNMIEQYEIYKSLSSSKNDDDDANNNNNNKNQNIVTAIIQFGKQLDGHPGIVHGGIIALILGE